VAGRVLDIEGYLNDRAWNGLKYGRCQSVLGRLHRDHSHWW